MPWQRHCRTAKAESTESPETGRDVWDPITRIVGSLGIYTKIDFAKPKSPSATAPRRSFAATASS
jgi:hypothetical protein